MSMLRKITLLTALTLWLVSSVQAQGIKFGVHVDPQVSWLSSNEKKVVPDGINMGFGFGVELESYFSEGENYALTFGASFGLSKGGKLKYENGGILLPNTELDQTLFHNSAGMAATTGANMELVNGTTIRYNINYVEVPVGLKLRTNELGSSYMRAFFHLPIATVMVPVSVKGNVDAAQPGPSGYNGYWGTSKGENLTKEIFPIQVMLGTGAGVEYSPNEEGGLRLVGGFYYNYGFIDAIKKNQTYDVSGTLKENKARSGMHNIGLRIGIIF